LIKLIPYYIRS